MPRECSGTLCRRGANVADSIVAEGKCRHATNSASMICELCIEIRIKPARRVFGSYTSCLNYVTSVKSLTKTRPHGPVAATGGRCESALPGLPFGSYGEAHSTGQTYIASAITHVVRPDDCGAALRTHAVVTAVVGQVVCTSRIVRTTVVRRMGLRSPKTVDRVVSQK
jgi:hypothetical protein